MDVEDAIARVQVKTATTRSRHGRLVVHTKTAGGNQSFHTVTPFGPALVDLLYLLTDGGIAR